MNIIHKNATDDFTGLAELANATPDAFILITGKDITMERWEAVRSKLNRDVKWKISKKTYAEALEEIK